MRLARTLTTFAALLVAQSVALADRTVDASTVGPAVSQTRSTIALVDGASAELRLLKSVEDVAPLATAKVSSRPIAIAWKQLGDQGYFIVLCEGDGGFYIFDDAAGKQVAKIQVTGDAPKGLVADRRPESPYVYYAGVGRDGRESPQVVGRLNLKTMKDEGWLVTRGPSHEFAYNFRFVMAADGRSIYAMRPGVSPSGILRMQIDEPTDKQPQPALTKLVYQHDSWSDLLADPAGRFIASKGAVRSPDLASTTGKLAGSPLCALTKRPVLFVWNGPTLEALSSNDFRTVGKVELNNYIEAAQPARNGPQGQRRPPQQPQLPDVFGGFTYEDNRQVVLAQPDEAGGRLIVRMRSKLFEIPLRDFSLPDEPLLAAPIVAATEAEIGKPWTGEVKSLDPRGTITLREVPQGLTLTSGKLAWTPTESQIGSQKVEVIVSWEKTRVAQSIEVAVRRPSLKLPYRPNQMAVSPDGGKTLILKLGFDERFGGRRRAGNSADPQIAVIDNATLKIVAERKLTEPVAAAIIDNDRVYLSARDSAAIKVLSARDLKDERTVFTKAATTAFALSGKTLALSSNNNVVSWLSLPDLKPLEIGGDARDPFRSDRGVGFIDDRIIIGGVEYDATTMKPTRQASRSSTVTLGGADDNPGLRNDYGVFSTYRFGTRAYQGSLLRLSKPPIGLGIDREGAATVLPDIPVAATLTVATDRNNNEQSQRIKATLAIRDLVSGKVLSQTPLQDEPLTNELMGDSSFGETHRAIAVPGMLVLSVYDRLYCIPTADYAKLNPPMPLVLKRKNFPASIAGKAETLEWEIVGGKAPYRIEMVTSVPGATPVENKPAITLDPKSFTPSAVPIIVQAMQNMGVAGNTGGDRLNAYAERERKRIKDAIDLDLKQVPAVAVIGMRVTDADNQTFTANEFVLVDVPTSAFKEELAKLDRATEAGAQRRNQAMGGGNTDALQNRIRELEQENARLRGQVEVLTDLLRDRKSTTRPSN